MYTGLHLLSKINYFFVMKYTVEELESAFNRKLEEITAYFMKDYQIGLEKARDKTYYKETKQEHAHLAVSFTLSDPLTRDILRIFDDVYLRMGTELEKVLGMVEEQKRVHADAKLGYEIEERKESKTSVKYKTFFGIPIKKASIEIKNETENHYAMDSPF